MDASNLLCCPVLWYEEVSGTSTHISTRHTSTLTNHRQCWTIIYYGAQYFALGYSIVRHITIKEYPVIYTTQLYDSLLYIAVNCTLHSSTVLVRSKKWVRSASFSDSIVRRNFWILCAVSSPAIFRFYETIQSLWAALDTPPLTNCQHPVTNCQQFLTLPLFIFFLIQ